MIIGVILEVHIRLDTRINPECLGEAPPAQIQAAIGGDGHHRSIRVSVVDPAAVSGNVAGVVRSAVVPTIESRRTARFSGPKADPGLAGCIVVIAARIIQGLTGLASHRRLLERRCVLEIAIELQAQRRRAGPRADLYIAQRPIEDLQLVQVSLEPTADKDGAGSPECAHAGNSHIEPAINEDRVFLLVLVIAEHNLVPLIHRQRRSRAHECRRPDIAIAAHVVAPQRINGRPAVRYLKQIAITPGY